MKPTPDGWQRFTSAVVYADAVAAIDWLCKAFNFQVRLLVEGDAGRVEHCELSYGDGCIMVAQERPESTRPWQRVLRSPRSIAGHGTQSLMIYVDDVDAHCAHARNCGATIIEELATHDYGADYWSDRSYGAVDPEGHVWWITQRVRSKAAG